MMGIGIKSDASWAPPQEPTEVPYGQEDWYRTRQAYEETVNYFSRPGAKLAKPKKGMLEGALEGPSCMYRTPDGRGCAVGCRISDALLVEMLRAGWDPDEHYSTSIEGLVNRALRQGELGEKVLAITGRPGWALFEWQKIAQALHDNVANDAEDLLVLLRGAWTAFAAVKVGY